MAGNILIDEASSQRRSAPAAAGCRRTGRPGARRISVRHQWPTPGAWRGRSRVGAEARPLVGGGGGPERDVGLPGETRSAVVRAVVHDQEVVRRQVPVVLQEPGQARGLVAEGGEDQDVGGADRGGAVGPARARAACGGRGGASRLRSSRGGRSARSPSPTRPAPRLPPRPPRLAEAFRRPEVLRPGGRRRGTRGGSRSSASIAARQSYVEGRQTIARSPSVSRKMARSPQTPACPAPRPPPPAARSPRRATA